MPIKHAALKQLRKDRKRQARNSAFRSELKTLTKRFQALLQAKKLEEAKALIGEVSSSYDRAAKKGILHRNTAARYKSRFNLQLNRLSVK